MAHLGFHTPLDGEACDTGLLCQDLPLHLLDDGLGRRVQGQGLVCVLVVHIVSDTHELAPLVAAAEQDDRDADDLAVGDARQVRGVSAELELVDADGERADEDGVEFLIVLVSGACSLDGAQAAQFNVADLRGRGANVGQLPLEICRIVSDGKTL
jgi:hypothetical protein